MAEVQFNSLMADLKAGNYQPVYFLQGEETYFIDAVTDYIADHALTEAEKGFNQTVVYGKDTELGQLVDTLMRYPMMATRQVVILKEAQDLKGIEKLESYFKNPMASTVFVVAHKHKKVRKNSKLLNALGKTGVLLIADRIKEHQLPQFVNDLARQKHLPLENAAINLLVQYVGADIALLEKQMDKLGMNVKDRPINTGDIEKYVGISKEYNVFELVSALALRNATKALTIAEYMVKNPKSNPAPVVLGFLYSFFSKAFVFPDFARMNDNELSKAAGINWYMVKDLRAYAGKYPPAHAAGALSLLHEYDLKIKGVDYPSSDKEILIRELVYKLLH